METKRIKHTFILASGLLVLASCRGTSGPAEAPASDVPEAARSAPVAPAEHRPLIRTAPAGTVVEIELLEPVASNSSEEGDRVRGRVAHDVLVDGALVIPAGSSVSGVVTQARGLKKIGGRAELGLEFTTLDPPSGPPSDLHASYHATGKSETKKDAATIGGAAAGGALLGRILGHKQGNEARGTVIGGVVGGGVGTAVAAKTKGQEIVLPAGHVLTLKLSGPVQVTLRG